MANLEENSETGPSIEKASWYDYFVNKFHNIVSFFKSSNPIGNILLQAEDFGFEYLPFDDYGKFDETEGL